MRPANVTIYNLDNNTNTTEEIMMPTLITTDFRKNQSYSRDYVLIANSIALVFIPMIVLLVLNCLIFREISRATQRHNAISSHQRRDHSVAKMLIFIVVCFILCHSIRYFDSHYIQYFDQRPLDTRTHLQYIIDEFVNKEYLFCIIQMIQL